MAGKIARNTTQRRVISDVLETARAPLSPPEILAHAQKALPTLGIATVYRELKRLADEGGIHSVEVPGDAPRYEKAGLHHHHHFKCESCQKLFDIEGCVEGIKKILPKGFTHHSHEIVIYGVCDDCR